MIKRILEKEYTKKPNIRNCVCSHSHIVEIESERAGKLVFINLKGECVGDDKSACNCNNWIPARRIK